MPHLIHVQHEFDLSYGSVDITWTDDAGAGKSITAISTGIYRHITSAADTLTHPAGDGTTIANTAHPSFGAALGTLMTAAAPTGPTITCTYSNTTNRYTLAATGALFSVTWAAGAETRMRNLLGFAGNLSGATSYTGTLAPMHTIEPRVVGLAKWSDVEAMADTVPKRITGNGRLVTVGPNRVPHLARFEFAHETDAQTLAEFSTRYSWQQFWNEAGRFGRTCYLVDASPPVGSDLRWAFQLNTPVWEKSTHRREREELRNRWRVMVDALLVGRW